MRFGFVLPGGTATEQLEQAVLADKAGWDGVFAWESSYGIDPWTLLAGIAQRTSRIRLGTMLTPLPWRRPWKLASQVVTLDQLSAGRAILAVGTGAVDPALGTTGETEDLRERADRLDEGIDLITNLWQGRWTYAGRHYQVDLAARAAALEPTTRPVQQPRIPIWVVGAWPRPKSMRRVLRCDGLLPNTMDANGLRDTTPDDIRDLRQWLNEHGARPDFDIVSEGETPAGDPEAAATIVAPWAEAGSTWWLEARWMVAPEDQAQVVRERILAGPPRVARE
jgi:alkanesulfonate monooxygenase SsuD/methylene tetrahydromethanopterin reductase-like flavin-dependent oxidoreductase (luciferase family)